MRYGYSVSVQISQDERDQYRRKEFFRKQEEIARRTSEMMEFVEVLREFFKTEYSMYAEELIRSWEKQKFNKEFILANIQVQGMLKRLSVPDEMVDRWNQEFETFSEQHKEGTAK